MPLQVNLEDVKTVIKIGIDGMKSLDDIRKLLLKTAYKLAMNPESVLPDDSPSKNIEIKPEHRIVGAGVSMFGAD